MITDALVPPKPNEFDSATLISRLRGVCGTRSIAVCTDGFSRLMVGGAMLSRIARMLKIASTAPAAPSKCPVDDLVDDIEFDFVTGLRRGAVCVDIVDIGRGNSGALHRGAHAAEGAIAVRRRRR